MRYTSQLFFFFLVIYASACKRRLVFCRLRRVSSTPQLYTSLSSWWGYVCKKQRVLRCTATLEETTASGMDSKQPQVTSDEPAVNISGKLSLLQQVFTLYIIYIYIIFIYIYILMPQPTQRAHCRIKVQFQGSRQGQ